MQAKVLILAALCGAMCFAQTNQKPAINSVTGVPSEPFIALGNCSASWSGYLVGKHGKTKITQAEMGKFIQSSLREGYTLTIYPETKSGIFVNMECVAKAKTTEFVSRP